MTCSDCMSGTPHAFRVRVADIEGPAWWVTLNAIGPIDARNLGREKARDAGAIEPGVLTVDHADPWAPLRHLSEQEKREYAGR